MENPSAISVPIPGIIAGDVQVCVVQGQSKSAPMVKLATTPAFIASLSDRAPDPLNNAPTALRFYRELMVIGEGIIPDTDSDQPKTALAPDDEVNETTEMLASNAMFMVRDGMFSIASARNRDTLVVQVVPESGVRAALQGVPLDGDTFLNNRSRRVTSKRLIAPKVCAGFIPTDATKPMMEVKSVGEKTTVTLKHSTAALKSNLIYTPRSEMNTVWTYRVGDFRPTAQAVAGTDQTAKLKADFLPLVRWSRFPGQVCGEVKLKPVLSCREFGCHVMGGMPPIT
jgi:hypothetical protein